MKITLLYRVVTVLVVSAPILFGGEPLEKNESPNVITVSQEEIDAFMRTAIGDALIVKIPSVVYENAEFHTTVAGIMDLASKEKRKLPLKGIVGLSGAKSNLRVTINFKNAPLIQILYGLAASAGCSLRIDGDQVIMVEYGVGGKDWVSEVLQVSPAVVRSLEAAQTAGKPLQSVFQTYRVEASLIENVWFQTELNYIVVRCIESEINVLRCALELESRGVEFKK